MDLTMLSNLTLAEIIILYILLDGEKERKAFDSSKVEFMNSILTLTIINSHIYQEK